MTGSLAARIAVLWQELVTQYDWGLVQSPTAVLEQAAAKLTDVEAVSEQHIRATLMGLYSRYLYQALHERNDRAAQELWLFCQRLALRRGLSRDQSDEVAQETVKRVLEQLPNVRHPEAIFGYTAMVLRTVVKPAPQPQSESLDAQEPDYAQLAAPVSTDEVVERRAIDRQLYDLISETLSNALERTVVIRIVLFDDKPRDVARDLDVPLPRARLAKSRGLDRLRKNEKFMRFCQSFRNNDQSSMTDSEEISHDT